MTYVIGAAAGIAFGALVAFLKNIFIWKKYGEFDASSGVDPAQASQIYIRSMVSFAVNVGTLLIVFLLREKLPFSFVACIIGTAASLAILNRIFARRQVKSDPDQVGDGKK